MAYVLLLHAPDKEAVLNAMRMGNASFEDGVELFDDELKRDIVRSSKKWGAKERVIARYETDGTPIDVWSTFFRVIETSNPESVACFAVQSEAEIDTFIRPLVDLGLCVPINNDKEVDEIKDQYGYVTGVKSRLWVKNPKRPYENISLEDKETIQRAANMLPEYVEIDDEMILIDRMPTVTGV